MVKVELSIFERVLVLNGLPDEGRRDLHKVIDGIYDAVGFEGHELEALGVSVETGLTKWTPELAAKAEKLGTKTIDLGAKGWEVVFAPLKKAEEAGELKRHQTGLYDKLAGEG